MAGEAMYTLRALILLALAVGFLQVVNSESCSVMMSVDAGQDGHLLRQQTMSAFRATCRKDKKNKPTAVTIQKLVCEFINFAINCGDDEIISVKWALYGFVADSTHRCFVAGYAGPCDGDETASLEKVQSECQGKRQCNFTPNIDWYGSDPCPRVVKYLNVTYVCLLDNV
ncbi:D-galactoside-specific lectin-like [Asterias amurensis]|uniref:D-galactoside-specific lectin-like n=1 Tax=Asterias amurensis TaxID=7602 RepID=UPI003AB44635